MAKITKKKFMQACKKSGGKQAYIAQALEVSRQSVSVYLKKNPKLKELLAQEGETIIDVAEHNIDRDIMAGDTKVSQWKLLNSKKGKARGYGPKQEVEHLGDTSITFLEVIKTDKEIRDGRKIKYQKNGENDTK